MGVTRFGAYTTHLFADIRCIRPLPTDWEYEHGAATPAQGVTAWYGLHQLGDLPHLPPITPQSPTQQQSSIRTILVHSAAGGVGLFCLSIIRASGHRAIATVSSPSKADWLRKQCPWLPAEAIIVRATNASAWTRQLDIALKVIIRILIDNTEDSSSC
jgi:NADPH:quinone reductase-like Zn-dependent oxidoreductase